MTNKDVSAVADHALGVLREAVAEAIDRKRRLGQYWVVWDGEKPVEVHPDTETRPAAE
ncbi:hypothetical protein [Asticcacaulis sp. YBE204]|uniref:hypothetical protein n=1 Tax=Asticcacaulis sp. YBE204 TaxID=1282363 RepID=UPI0003C3B837|nr:hypothetical protein [Asticcacaulis sp. YBE204]ESQ77828.1 hypothetical protein AEYBE204_17010 [Asticcacaulis sp. YBE204]